MQTNDIEHELEMLKVFGEMVEENLKAMKYCIRLIEIKMEQERLLAHSITSVHIDKAMKDAWNKK